MLHKSDKRLLTFISLMPIALIGIFTLVLNAIVIHENQTKVGSLIQSLYSDALTQEKGRVKQQVDSIYEQIIYEDNLAEQTLKKSIQYRIEDAYSIIHFIYQQNEEKTKPEIIKLIADALRQTRFNDGRGYFFIYDMDGTNLMHPIFPEYEGKNLINFTDIHGKRVVEEHVKMMREKGEGFSQWWYPKPDNKDEAFEKIGYAKYFEPLDIYIGTGEYVVDVEEDIQQILLAWISEVRYGDDGYIFVFDHSGNILSHQDKSLINTNIYNKTDINPYEFMNTLNSKFDDNNSRFSKYLNRLDAFNNGSDSQLSYIKKYDKWDWVISGGVYTDTNKRLLEKKEKILIQQNQEELKKILLLTLTLALILTLLSLSVSKYVAMRFNKFQDRICNDFEVLEKTKNKMQYMALHDGLTQLPNRVMLESRIEEEIVKAQQSGKMIALMFVDLDDFKKVNDHYGHDVGDKLLTLISSRFSHFIEKDEMVARFGGDEFVFCFSNLTSQQDAELWVEKIQSVFEDVFSINGKEITTGCSIGVAMYPKDATCSSELISKADIVLYKSKDVHKGASLFFDKSIDEQVSYEFSLEEELKNALDKREVTLVYQPQIDTKTGEIYGVEVLSRWCNNKLGSVSPVKFIAVAEEIGMIDQLGDFVLQQACEDIQEVMPNGTNTIMLSVNISPKQLIRKGFVSRIMKIVSRTGIDVSRITFEITENILISDLKSVSPILLELQKLGFGISLDDFGTGYSSLSYLNILPITEIKIDRSFVSSLFTNDQSESLIKAIIAIGASCQMKVVAEGVETKEQLDKLKEYQCDLVQGYYLDKPLSISELKAKYT
ncbi:EAL domain-containing protein [Aliivibrio fischeri]|uniref:bifunctional diguanylate cyclase/phosphodiesterase n=1 Tax=Aliivibrio fischeri TaxID=668 RepID=UPI0012DA61FC|nr:cache domain-containing protein [Aliivibrio fischeri]MUK42810.1 EAL domain-containing protein [Aliivibrio fischeri]